MRIRVTTRLVAVALVLALANSFAAGYIHFPPMTLPKMCKVSTHIRVLNVKKHDKEKGIVVFEVVDVLKGKSPRIKSFRHVIRPDTNGVQPIFGWVGKGKRAVMFSIEADSHGAAMACGYVFIDGYCYSVDYNMAGDYWLVIRGEPQMSACYHGAAEQLQTLARDVLDGKDVMVPVMSPAVPETKADWEKRFKEVTEKLKKNRE